MEGYVSSEQELLEADIPTAPSDEVRKFLVNGPTDRLTGHRDWQEC
jgi:hypothetical protein